ncbi:hypothetical protein [Mesorhizobium sp. ORS 3428]|nr:hypothetical protein [Mesorhizobium sp. ORS 3428]
MDIEREWAEELGEKRFSGVEGAARRSLGHAADPMTPIDRAAATA